VQKSDFEVAVREIEKKFVNERIVFLKTIPAFNINITRSKLQNLCKHFQSVSLIKNQQLYREGDPNKYVYIVRSGELKICKRILMPKNDEECDELKADPHFLQQK
jgi:hypothetical protein